MGHNIMRSLRPKQEAFIHHYLSNGGNGRRAYRSAYDAEGMSDTVVVVKASELLKNGKITVRLRELQERTAQKAERTIESIDAMLQSSYECAERQHNASTMVSATMALAKLHGLIVKKREDVSHFDRRRSVAEIEAELAEFTREANSRMGADLGESDSRH